MSQKCHFLLLILSNSAEPPNGSRYPLVGGTGQRRFAGINYKLRKLLNNAQTPTSRVHALLGGVVWNSILLFIFYSNLPALLTKILLLLLAFSIGKDTPHDERE